MNPNIIFEEKRQFFGENWRNSHKLETISSQHRPLVAVGDRVEFVT
jgi:hypothetical protein